MMRILKLVARVLDNGTIITRAKSPIGNGNIYYVEGGPEGKVQVIDTYLIPMHIIAACMAWELDTPTKGCNKDPKCEFRISNLTI